MDPKLDGKKVQAFAGEMLATLNHGMLALMVSVGHRTGLFDQLAQMGPATSTEIARAAGLDERYVREWLGAMASGRLVEYDGRAGTFHLPPEHAACLTRAAGPNNLAVFAQGVGLYGGVESDVIACFQRGGGVPYDRFHRFHDVTAELGAVVHDALLIDRIVPALGLGDPLARGVDVLDVGCGRGHTLNLLARAFPTSRFTGIDLCEDTIAGARAEAAAMGLENARFEQRDSASLGDVAAYDLVTAFDAIHDQADPAGVLARIRAALRPGGTFLCVDIAAASNLADNLDHPLGPTLYTVSTLHCVTVSLAQGGPGLGAMWGQELAVRMITDAGFGEVQTRRIDGDLMNNYYVARA